MSADYKITKNDCTNILKQHLNTTEFEIINFQEQSVTGEVVGIMAGHFKLKTKAKVGDKIISNSFFVKRMTSPFEIQTQMIKEQGAYEKEYFVYKTLAQLYEKTPNYKCDYLAKCYLTIDKDLFVFEDAIESGCTPSTNVLDLLDMDHLKLALKTIAKFHAGSIIYETKQTLLTGKPYKMTDEYYEYFKDSLYRKESSNYLGNKFYTTSVDSILALIDIVPHFKQNRNEIRTKFLNAVEQVYDLVKPSNKYCNVICHGDLWNSNILFKYKDEKPISCVLLDFQAIRYTIPAHDFMYFIRFNCGATDSENFKVLGKYYYDCLAKYLQENNIDINKHMNYDEFLESLDYILPFIIVQNVSFATICLMRMYDLMKDQNLVKTFLYESRTELCLKAYKENDEFRKIVDQTIIDLRELK